MAAMAPQEDINPEQLYARLRDIAIGFQALMNTSDTTDGRSAADQQKRAALTVLANNFNLGCGMFVLANSNSGGIFADAESIANHISQETASTIFRWYDQKIATAGFAMVDMIEGCKAHTGGGKNNGHKYRQRGGVGMPDRYDIFTMILIGGSATASFTGLTAAGLNTQVVVGASNYVINTVISLAVKMGTFKAQCDSASETSWNLFKQYTVGQFVPVESCLQKIQYNEAQITYIKTALSSLAVSLGGVTSYVSANAFGNGMSAVYSAIKTNISIPVVDQILRIMSQSYQTVCRMTTASLARRASLRSASSETPPHETAHTQAQVRAEVDAIKRVNKKIKQLVGTEEMLSPEAVEQIIEMLKALPLAEPDNQEANAMTGGRRRRKQGTRKPRKGKKSKTAKRGQKEKSKRKARKGKKSRKTRRGTRHVGK